MLEIILVFILSRKNGRMAKEKGYKAGRFIFLTVALWFTCEIIATMIATIYSKDLIMIMGIALLGGISGGAITVIIINSLKVKNFTK